MRLPGKANDPGVSTGPLTLKLGEPRAESSEDSSLLERHESTILVDGLQCAAAKLQADVNSEFWNPNTLGLKIRGNGALHHFRDVTTDTALFLGQTGTVDSAAGADAGSSNTANTGHNKKFVGLRGAKNGRGCRPVKTNPAGFVINFSADCAAGDPPTAGHPGKSPRFARHTSTNGRLSGNSDRSSRCLPECAQRSRARPNRC